MGGSFSPNMILYVLLARSFLPVITSYLQPTLLFWSLEITARGVPPTVDLQIQCYIFFLQTL